MNRDKSEQPDISFSRLVDAQVTNGMTVTVKSTTKIMNGPPVFVPRQVDVGLQLVMDRKVTSYCVKLFWGGDDVGFPGDPSPPEKPAACALTGRPRNAAASRKLNSRKRGRKVANSFLTKYLPRPKVLQFAPRKARLRTACLNYIQPTTTKSATKIKAFEFFWKRPGKKAKRPKGGCCFVVSGIQH